MSARKQFFGAPISISAAPGWFAVYLDKDGNEEKRDALACWALTDQETIEGMISDGNRPDFAEKWPGFGYYIHKPMTPADSIQPSSLGETP